VLIKIWKIMDYICGKRLQPVIAELVTVLESHNELRCEQQTRAKLLRISAATIDRLLKPERRKYESRAPSKSTLHHFSINAGGTEVPPLVGSVT
jgi:hypothetical protein